MMNIASEVLQVGGAACKVADLAEELIELLESLGPDLLSRCTELDEFYEFRDAVESYLQVRDATDVTF